MCSLPRRVPGLYTRHLVGCGGCCHLAQSAFPLLLGVLLSGRELQVVVLDAKLLSPFRGACERFGGWKHGDRSQLFLFYFCCFVATGNVYDCGNVRVWSVSTSSVQPRGYWEAVVVGAVGVKGLRAEELQWWPHWQCLPWEGPSCGHLGAIPRSWAKHLLLESSSDFHKHPLLNPPA